MKLRKDTEVIDMLNKITGSVDYNALLGVGELIDNRIYRKISRW